VRPIGSIVSLYYDGWAVAEEGDVIQTTTGRSYRVISNRIQEKGKHAGRQHIKAMVIEPEDVSASDVVLKLWWYKR
jgi:hypothetical protein